MRIYRIATFVITLLTGVATFAQAEALSPDACQRDIRCTVASVLDLLKDRKAGRDRYRLPAYGYVAMAMSISGAPAEEVSRLHSQIRSEISAMKQIPNSIDQMVAYMIIDDFLSSPEPTALQTVATELESELARRSEQMRRYGTMSPLCRASFTLLSGELGYDPAMRQRVVSATRKLPECRVRIDRALAEQDTRSGIAFGRVFMPDRDSFKPRNKNYRHYRNLMIAFGGRDQVKAEAIARAWLNVSKRKAKQGRLRPRDAVWAAIVLAPAGYESIAKGLLDLADETELHENALSSTLKIHLSASLTRLPDVLELMRVSLVRELNRAKAEARGFTTMDHPEGLRVAAARLMLALDLDPNGWEN